MGELYTRNMEREKFEKVDMEIKLQILNPGV